MRMKQNIVDGACIVDFCALKDVTMRSVPRQWSRSPVPFSSMNHHGDLLLLTGMKGRGEARVGARCFASGSDFFQ